MISKRAIPLIALTFSLLGCAQSNSQSYADAVLNRPMPPDGDARMRECAWIRSEIARQQGLAGVGATMATTPLMAAAYQAVAQRKIAALEFKSLQHSMHGGVHQRACRRYAGGQSFDQCFARCQQYTDRTKDQCFDACNK